MALIFYTSAKQSISPCVSAPQQQANVSRTEAGSIPSYARYNNDEMFNGVTHVTGSVRHSRTSRCR